MDALLLCNMLLLAKYFHIHYLIDFSLPLTFHLITHRKKKILERLTFASKEWLNQNPNMSVLATDKTSYLITKFAMLDVN